MAKSPGKPVGKVESSPRSRWWLHALAVVLFLGAALVVVKLTRQFVDQRVARQTRPATVVLKDQPAWMSDVLAEQIIAAVSPDRPRSAFDQQLLVETAERLRANPWVAKVRQVRRGYGKSAGDTIEVVAEYRTPAALVRWGDYYSLIDGKGVKLPEQYARSIVEKLVFGRDGRVNVRVIEGVANPPPEPGKAWRGDDIQAGLEMARLLFDHPFAQDIVKINVENYARRKSAKEAQIVLKTRYGTEIRWGRPPSAQDFFIEVATDQKLANLEQIYRQYGRADAKQPWLDIRFDKITYPAPQATAAQ